MHRKQSVPRGGSTFQRKLALGSGRAIIEAVSPIPQRPHFPVEP
jgi:hypothetical protein